MAEYVTIHAFVRAPYDKYVNDETRFWNASGISIKLAGTGVEFQMESLKALLLGGGIVIKVGDEVVGAIGAAGAPGGDLDDACADAGLDKIKDQLK
jgi:paraquat-inducible protein B